MHAVGRGVGARHRGRGVPAVRSPAAAIGVAIVAAHALAFVALAGRSAGHELSVVVTAPLASPRLALAGTVPAALAGRVTETVDDDRPGLRRARWRVAYRGGYVREVGATQLVGPFQEPGGAGVQRSRDRRPGHARSGRGRDAADRRCAAPRRGDLPDRRVPPDRAPRARVGPVRDAPARCGTTRDRGRAARLHPRDRADRVRSRRPCRSCSSRCPSAPTPSCTSGRTRTRRSRSRTRSLQWLNRKLDVTTRLATRVANHELDDAVRDRARAAATVRARCDPDPDVHVLRGSRRDRSIARMVRCRSRSSSVAAPPGSCRRTSRHRRARRPRRPPGSRSTSMSTRSTRSSTSCGAPAGSIAGSPRPGSTAGSTPIRP